MKKLSFILAALAILGVACNKQETPENTTTPEEDAKEMVRIELKVSVDPETRATMDGLDLKFGVDDEISVLGTSGSTTDIYYLTAESVDQSTGVITFSTSVPADVEIGDYAYYPSDIMAPSGSDPIDPLLICWPSMIYCSEGVKIPMIAPIDLTNNTAEFKHLGAMLKVNLTNTPADFSWLEFRTSAKFGGWYEVDPSDFSMNLVDDPSNLNWEVIQGIGDGVYYIPIPAGSYSNFQLGMMSEDPTGYPYGYCKQRTANLATPINPARGQIVNLGDFTNDVDEIAEWYMVGPSNGWNATSKDTRYIKTDDNTYVLTGYCYRTDDDPGYRISDGETQYIAANSGWWSGALTEYQNNNLFISRKPGDGDGNCLFYAKMIKSGSSWTFDQTQSITGWDWCWSTTGTYLSLYSNISGSWSDSQMTKYDYNNNMCWSTTISVPTNSEYEFKIKSWAGSGNDDWYHGKNGLVITDSKPYGAIESGNTGNNIKLQLTPGDYKVYLDLHEWNIMFVKQPIVYDPGLTPQP